MNNASVMCPMCARVFDYSENRKANQNSLRQHMQVHEPKNLPCPGCQKQFRKPANVAQHFESGYCSGCKGPENARNKMYDFARNNSQFRGYLNEGSMLEYEGASGSSRSVPDFPYKCPTCGKKFRQQSQVYQHQEKHQPNRYLCY